ncbi:MAG: hypothetical protein HY232_12290 [Acidobacteria bacterium]|nr:hypothetical protein [Acidobacteriota bacterium]
MSHRKYGFITIGWVFLMGMSVWVVFTHAAPPEDLFVLKCPLPFADKTVHHTIDAECSLSGLTESETGDDPDSHLQQNRAKNNLCAPDPAVPITVNLFDHLQGAVEEKEIPFGNQHIPNPEPLPDNRSVLKNLVQTANGISVGEGTNVVFAAFVLRTKVAGKESVNCEFTGKEANDIHIVLAMKPTDNECDSITAEMVPHFRPPSWGKITVQSTLAQLRKHPVRITGQMFFDASHSPCHHPEFRVQGDPKRRSLWEIHPVYKIDVCKNKTLAGCKVDKESVWKSFDAWVKNPQ